MATTKQRAEYLTTRALPARVAEAACASIPAFYRSVTLLHGELDSDPKRIRAHRHEFPRVLKEVRAALAEAAD